MGISLEGPLALTVLVERGVRYPPLQTRCSPARARRGRSILGAELSKKKSKIWE